MRRSGAISAQLNQLESYLKGLRLYANRNFYPNSGFSISLVRDLSFVDIWKMHVQNQWYDFRLDDNSLLFYHQDEDGDNFSYLGCPYESSPYCEFKDKAVANGIDRSEIEEMYEDYLFTCPIKENPNYFRYDYNEKTYREGEHPVAHLHCGLMEGVRIGFMKRLDVMSYAAFILRQVYIHKWDIILCNKNDYSELYNSKSKIADIHPNYYKEKDKNQDFYLV